MAEKQSETRRLTNLGGPEPNRGPRAPRTAPPAAARPGGGRSGHARAPRDLSDLASVIAHEMGTPLNVITGRAELIASGEADPSEIVPSARVILAQAQRLTQTIRRLLAQVRTSPDAPARAHPPRRPSPFWALERILVHLADYHAASGQHAELCASGIGDPRLRRLLTDLAREEAALANRINTARRDADVPVRTSRFHHTAIEHLERTTSPRSVDPEDVVHGCMEASLLLGNWLRRLAQRAGPQPTAHLLEELAAAHDAHARSLSSAYRDLH